jgi:hypothetical protein
MWSDIRFVVNSDSEILKITITHRSYNIYATSKQPCTVALELYIARTPYEVRIILGPLPQNYLNSRARNINILSVYRKTYLHYKKLLSQRKFH